VTRRAGSYSLCIQLLSHRFHAATSRPPGTPGWSATGLTCWTGAWHLCPARITGPNRLTVFQEGRGGSSPSVPETVTESFPEIYLFEIQSKLCHIPPTLTRVVPERSRCSVASKTKRKTWNCGNALQSLVSIQWRSSASSQAPPCVFARALRPGRTRAFTNVVAAWT